jgi:hypothetical protein
MWQGRNYFSDRAQTLSTCAGIHPIVNVASQIDRVKVARLKPMWCEHVLRERRDRHGGAHNHHGTEGCLECEKHPAGGQW